MKLLSHGPEPCASANSATGADFYLYISLIETHYITPFQNKQYKFSILFKIFIFFYIKYVKNVHILPI